MRGSCFLKNNKAKYIPFAGKKLKQRLLFFILSQINTLSTAEETSEQKYGAESCDITIYLPCNIVTRKVKIKLIMKRYPCCSQCSGSLFYVHSDFTVLACAIFFQVCSKYPVS
jgi:hypothetical protein